MSDVESRAQRSSLSSAISCLCDLGDTVSMSHVQWIFLSRCMSRWSCSPSALGSGSGQPPEHPSSTNPKDFAPSRLVLEAGEKASARSVVSVKTLRHRKARFIHSKALRKAHRGSDISTESPRNESSQLRQLRLSELLTVVPSFSSAVTSPWDH